MKTFAELHLLLYLLASEGTKSAIYDDENAHYCSICNNHVMCLYSYDESEEKCIDIGNAELDPQDIITILHEHNRIRNIIASGQEHRGNPGPQPTARNMLEVVWDNELALLARHWVLKCNLFEKDECRDVERFNVWQNVHVLELDTVENSTANTRIQSHIQSWYNEVEYFDSAAVGLINYNNVPENYSSYIALASAKINYVGCGRATYTIELNETEYDGVNVTMIKPGKRVEVLVCNYGPIFNPTISQYLYDIGAPGLCPNGTVISSTYNALCSMPEHKVYGMSQEKRENDERNFALPVARAITVSKLFVMYCIVLT